jgi:hypothetical protein
MYGHDGRVGRRPGLQQVHTLEQAGILEASHGPGDPGRPLDVIFLAVLQESVGVKNAWPG